MEAKRYRLVWQAVDMVVEYLAGKEDVREGFFDALIALNTLVAVQGADDLTHSFIIYDETHVKSSHEFFYG